MTQILQYYRYSSIAGIVFRNDGKIITQYLSLDSARSVIISSIILGILT
ncbi:MAG: hypothetical protein GDA56_31225 [Hormoscilla sp. GM7CHS1pb]|nr:hypothetical protein [Hormoscilla sp. GM7CHS1pb]